MRQLLVEDVFALRPGFGQDPCRVVQALGAFQRAVRKHQHRTLDAVGAEFAEFFVQGFAFAFGGNVNHVEILARSA